MSSRRRGFRLRRYPPVQALTQAYPSLFETCVRAHPEQGFWVDDRWKQGEKPADVARASAPLARSSR